MTGARAIELLKGIQFCCDFDDCTNAWDCDECVDAFNMAIEALEQEETLQNLTKPNKSDLISRQAAIYAIEKRMDDITCEEFAEGMSEAITEISLLPSAQPFTEEQIQTMQELESAQVEKAYELGKADRPTGRWHIEPGIGCFCSKCSFDIGNDLDFMEYVHYCPNCGCAMKGGEEE